MPSLKKFEGWCTLMILGMLALCVAAGGFVVAGVAAGPDASYRQDVEKWRAKHEADYRREYVGLAGLFSLKPGPNTVGSAPSSGIGLPKSAPSSVGRFVLSGDRVRFEPQAGVKATIKGQVISAPTELKHDEAKDGPDEIEVGGIALWVHLSGERRTIRMRCISSACWLSVPGISQRQSTWWGARSRWRRILRMPTAISATFFAMRGGPAMAKWIRRPAFRFDVSISNAGSSGSSNVMLRRWLLAAGRLFR